MKTLVIDLLKRKKRKDNSISTSVFSTVVQCKWRTMADLDVLLSQKTRSYKSYYSCLLFLTAAILGFSFFLVDQDYFAVSPVIITKTADRNQTRQFYNQSVG